MAPLSTVWKLSLVPWVIIKSIIQYYTVGTVYSRTNEEFHDSLYKNVHLAVIHHVSRDVTKEEARQILYAPFEKNLFKFKSHPIAAKLNNFGKRFDEHSYWIHQIEEDETSDNKSDVLIYFHGGGYMLNMSESQFLFPVCLHYAVNEETRNKLSIMVVDYSLSMFDHEYPTQLWEALNVYNKLVKSGYKNIHLVGDSCGAHLSLSVARSIAYPQETREQFSHFPKFPLNVSLETLPHPRSLSLDSPWVEPCANVQMPVRHGADCTGDLGSETSTMGDFFVGDADRALINNFLTFTNTNYSDHWAEVEAITNGKTLMFVGEREVLRDGIDDFYKIINKADNVSYHTEKGGIHAAAVYIETLDYMSEEGGKRAVEGDFEGKYGINLVARFLEQVV